MSGDVGNLLPLSHSVAESKCVEWQENLNNLNSSFIDMRFTFHCILFKQLCNCREFDAMSVMHWYESVCDDAFRCEVDHIIHSFGFEDAVDDGFILDLAGIEAEAGG